MVWNSTGCIDKFDILLLINNLHQLQNKIHMRTSCGFNYVFVGRVFFSFVLTINFRISQGTFVYIKTYINGVII